MDDEILKYLYDIKDAASATFGPYQTSSPGNARHTIYSHSLHCLLTR